MKAVLQIAAGVALGSGLIALAGANLGGHAAPAPDVRPAEPPGAPAVVPAAAVAPPAAAISPEAPAAPAETAAWRSRARAPDAIPPGMLARVARRVADRAPACAPPQKSAAAGAAKTPAALESPARAPEKAPPCRAGDVVESVEIDWNGAPRNP